ncbi:MAG: hypothetical protein WD278_19825 [Pirellulales bacterium]
MRRPFQFRLRTLFWLTALAAVLCVVGPAVATMYREHQKRLEPLLIIESGGGDRRVPSGIHANQSVPVQAAQLPAR